MNGKFKRISTLFMASTLVIVPIAVASGSSMAEASVDSSQVKVRSFSNQQLFDELEKNGYNLEDIFTKEEIEFYKAEDQMRAGKTQFVDHGDGTSTLYLSSAYTKTISGLGSAAATAIGGLIGVSGGVVGAIGGSTFGAFLGDVASSNIDTDRGLYINFKSQQDATGQYNLVAQEWGYQ